MTIALKNTNYRLLYQVPNIKHVRKNVKCKIKTQENIFELHVYRLQVVYLLKN